MSINNDEIDDFNNLSDERKLSTMETLKFPDSIKINDHLMERSLLGNNTEIGLYESIEKPCLVELDNRRKTILALDNLDSEFGCRDIYDLFNRFGNIVSCKLWIDKRGHCLGKGYIVFYDLIEVEKIFKEMNDRIFWNKKMTIRIMDH